MDFDLLIRFAILSPAIAAVVLFLGGMAFVYYWLFYLMEVAPQSELEVLPLEIKAMLKEKAGTAPLTRLSVRRAVREHEAAQTREKQNGVL